MSNLDASVIAQVVRNPSVYSELVAAGLDYEDFADDFQRVWKYISRMQREHDRIPSADQLSHRFEWLDLPSARKRDLPIQISDIKKRKEHNDLVTILRQSADMLGDPDEADDVKSFLLREINALSVRRGRSSIVDIFGSQAGTDILGEIKRRRSGVAAGLPTGLTKFDTICGGLIKQRMVVAIGRPGIGKSWMDLLFVREAVLAGGKIMLFPLEMTLFETALRLYTLFSQRIGGADRVLKNTDLQSGQISIKKVRKFLTLLEEHYAGQLLVADVGSLSDPYTVDRIEAEQQMHNADMIWIDYITLMKASGGMDSAEHVRVRELSNGVKGIAQRQDCVGGCSAQVSREALRTNILLPRLEHIAYGDSIGQDADQVFSLNRKGKHLYYALVKNRHGPEIGKTRVRFFPNEGLIQEMPDEAQDDEGEGA